MNRRALPLLLVALLGTTSCSQEPDVARPPAAGDVARSRDALRAFVDRYRKSPRTFGPETQDWADGVWTYQAWRSLLLAGVPVDPTAGAPDDRAAALRGLRRDQIPTLLVSRLKLARLWGLKVEEAGAPGVPFLPLMTWVGSPPLEELEARVTADVMRGRKVDVAALKQMVGFWRGPDGGYRYPAGLGEIYPRILTNATTFTAPPRPHLGTSTCGAIAAAVACLTQVGVPVPRLDAVVLRLRALRSGGHWSQQRNPLHDGTGLWATWNALRALSMLGVSSEAPDEIAAWLRTLRHRDGGFAHALDEPASLEATWLALECLRLIQRPLGPMPSKPAAGRLPKANGANDASLKPLQAVVQMGPDPAASVVLARRAGADLLLLKSLDHDEPALVARARRLAARLPGPKLEIACVREEHRSAWGVEGIGYVTHCSDAVFAPAVTLGQRGRHRTFDEILDAWKVNRLRGCVFFSCSYLNRELLAPAYDRSSRRFADGYDALMVGWAFARGGDLIRDYPWLHRYVGRMALIGNHDAHGDPLHWFHRGMRTRTLFFAKDASVASFQEAVRLGRTVAVVHGPVAPAYWGHPTWVEKAKARRADWDRGRPGFTPGEWLPAPFAAPIDASTQVEMPWVTRGFGILVRAAGRIADDAMPHEVTVRVGGEDEPRVPLRIVPADGKRPPALWAPLPDLKPGDHLVVVEAFGQTSRQTLRWVAPVAIATPPTMAPPPALEFRGANELPWVSNTSLAPGDFEGSLRIVCNRADFALRASPGKSRLRVKWRGGKAAGPLQFFVDGASVGAVTPNGSPGETSFDFDGATARAHRVTLRTALPGWISSFDRPKSDLELLLLAVETRP
ncbi:MAG: hypothetical protein CMJ83_02765 [Planctomycetes bacterium]|nr:hypothetical protein [Planctomycetota bacterium]